MNEARPLQKKDLPTIEVLPRTNDEKRTYVIFGVPRGGTTMVAGVARMCGLDIGSNLPDNCEDSLFSLDVIKRELGDQDQALEQIRSNVQQLSKEKSIWGWKFPTAFRYLRDIKSDLVNPHLIVVFRDAVAISTRRVVRGMDAVEALKRFTAMQNHNVDLISDWDVPTLLVSYEKAVSNPEGLVQGLCDFIGTENNVDMEEARDYMQPGRYKPVPTTGV
ncbi:sulfotransferase family protein [Henriciella litoralis]|uniref:hypothetical protein n=1 Tax=Henriciella litoralis TaxID=568102 RepID=UPI000A05A98C|nr:hypothetical protein [Henriciella litoralis]